MNQFQQPQQPSGSMQGTTSDHSKSGRQFPTQHYLPEDTRRPIIETLNWALADTTVLMTHAKYAHWNVKGMEFYALHQLFDELASVFETHADDIAERITALGGQAMGTADMAAAHSDVPQMPTDAVTGREYVEILTDHLAIHDANLYESIFEVQSYGDPDTEDLFTEISRDVSKYLWFLEAHLQARPAGTIPPEGFAQQPMADNSQVPGQAHYQGPAGGQ